MELNSNFGLTANGNQYKKSNTGKKAGMLVGGIIPTIASFIKLSQIKDKLDLKNSKTALESATQNVKGSQTKKLFVSLKTPEKLLTKANIKTGGIVACAIIGSAIVGTLLGNLYDKCINKERMAEADGEAKLIKNKNEN